MMISKTQNSPLMPGKKNKKIIYRIILSGKMLKSYFFLSQKPLDWKNYVFPLQKPLDVTNHSVAREVVTFFTLPPGEYIVMPQTNVNSFFIF